MEVEYTERRIQRRDKKELVFGKTHLFIENFIPFNQSGLSSFFYFHFKDILMRYM